MLSCFKKKKKCKCEYENNFVTIINELKKLNNELEQIKKILENNNNVIKNYSRSYSHSHSGAAIGTIVSNPNLSGSITKLDENIAVHCPRTIKLLNSMYNKNSS